MVVVAEEIDLTLSDDDSGEEEGRGNARQLPLEPPTVSPVVTPIKCKSEPATQPTAAGNDNYGGGGVDVDEDGLKPAITGEFVSFLCVDVHIHHSANSVLLASKSTPATICLPL